jgi:hypothetical protein
MKHILFAAAAATTFIAAPAFAQSTGGTGSATPVGPGAKVESQTGNVGANADATSQSTQMSSDTSMSQQTSSQSMPAQSTGSMSTGGTMTTGGYMPSGPATQGGMTPGATVQFRPAPSPSQAYPAPAPLASYPICKKGQYDKCMQRGGR